MILSAPEDKGDRELAARTGATSPVAPVTPPASRMSRRPVVPSHDVGDTTGTRGRGSPVSKRESRGLVPRPPARGYSSLTGRTIQLGRLAPAMRPHPENAVLGARGRLRYVPARPRQWPRPETDVHAETVSRIVKWNHAPSVAWPDLITEVSVGAARTSANKSERDRPRWTHPRGYQGTPRQRGAEVDGSTDERQDRPARGRTGSASMACAPCR